MGRPSSGVLNLDSRSYVHRADQLCDGRSLIFIRDAKAALHACAATAAADGENSLKKLTLTSLAEGHRGHTGLRPSLLKVKKISTSTYGLIPSGPGVKNYDRLRLAVVVLLQLLVSVCSLLGSSSPVRPKSPSLVLPSSLQSPWPI
jgi:hypothetical protein